MRIILRGVPPSLNAFAGRENTWEYRKAKKEWAVDVQDDTARAAAGQGDGAYRLLLSRQAPARCR